MEIEYEKTYVENYHKTPGIRYKNILDNIKIKKTDIVLDIGCGSGFLLEKLKEKIQKYDGIDTSNSFIEICKKKFPSSKIYKFHKKEITSFCDKKPNTYTKAFLLDFTEHIDDKTLKKILLSIINSLKKTGKLIIHTPNKKYFIEILKDKGIIKQFPGHIAIRNAKEYETLLKNTNFNKIKTICLPHYNILRHFHILAKLPFIGKYFQARLLIIAEK
jgi:2-polyprenyl-6-hydroxyphenyl methylase / 3-demethylubiquinone-9 3-methyltransferase